MSEFLSQYADVNGIRSHYVSVGTGNLVMFVHGFPEFWAEWENQLTDIGKDHQAVAPDMRGYNLSSKPANVESYHVKDLIEDLRALAESLGYEKLSLVAHDWGGAVAWSFAIRYPDWLEKLIIINSPHPAIFARELLHNPDQQKASQYMLMFRSPDAERILSENSYAGLMSTVSQFGSKWEMTEAVRKRYIEAWSRPGALTGGLNYYRVSPLYPPISKKDEEKIQGILNLPHEMLAVKVPTLVIWGELDQALLTGNLDGLGEYVSSLTIRRIPDGSHWVTHEQPELVNSLIRDFLLHREQQKI
ncbi:MAG: alpha/beta hydrolase [Desulfobacteraceae bacterium]|jgi:pimeloyl-ACP methyl ester carboxylesterase|nr:alpha/beta hydrolase [Desulfobacteraceae bacterium]